MSAIVVEDLQKRYGDTDAVRGLSFEVAAGEVFALVGPNGAGKTTTVEILEGHRSRSGGEVSVLGFDPATGGQRYRERIGIVLQEAGLDEEFTVAELVELYAGFYRRPREAGEVISLVGLEDKRDARAKTLSGGQRRRLDLALGLIGDPELIFLDEPTTGFDPSARRRAWDVVRGLSGGGITVVLTTHYMEEARALADRVGVIAAGRLVAVGTPDELTDVAGQERLIRFTLPRGVSDDDLPGLDGLRVEAGSVVVPSTSPTEDLHRLTDWALRRDVVLDDLAMTPPSFEDTYLQLVERAGRTDG
jgi:ABC-2 type transport system ATP-binding protein